MIYSRTIEKNDPFLTGNEDISKGLNLLAGLPYSWGHDMRLWEYGLADFVIKEYAEPQMILDIGGNAAPFSVIEAMQGHDVTILDPIDCTNIISSFQKRLETVKGAGRIRFHQISLMDAYDEKYDIVTCLSVIEHVVSDIQFFVKMLHMVRPGGTFILTTDFHPSGEPKCQYHIRTYNRDSMLALETIAFSHGFRGFAGQSSNYDHFGLLVNSYTFASLVMIKED